MLARRPPADHHRARSVSTGRLNRLTVQLHATPDYLLVRTVGTGTFGAVFEVRDREGKSLAVKKVLQDPRYKNRELGTLKKLDHPNCMKLIRHFFTREGNPAQTYLHIVSELLPCDLLKYCRKGPLPIDTVRVFGYQIFRALAYLHSIGICHRDIKPTNVLIDPETGRLQLCDFGSAKPMQSGDVGVSYIATRSYRAPELLFDNTKYTFAIDVWAAGCVMGEMLRGGTPLFRGSDNINLIQNIATVIGPATPDDVNEYGTGKVVNCTQDPPKGIETAIGRELEERLKDLLTKIFVYSPRVRITAEECLNHPFFDEVVQGRAVLANGKTFTLPPG